VKGCWRFFMQSVSNERGSVLVFITLMIIILLVMVGFGLDTGQLAFVRSQGQRAVDAAALAGTSAVPTGVDQEVFNRVTAFNTTGSKALNDYVGSGTAANKLSSSHVTFIMYDKSKNTITKVNNALEANGVRVALEDANPYNGPVGGAMASPLFLTPLLNLLGSSTSGSRNVTVSAVAYSDPIPGLPIALTGCPLPNPTPTKSNPNPPPTCTEDGVTDSCTTTGGVTQCYKCNVLQVPSPRDNACFTTYTFSSANAKSMRTLIQNNKTCGAIPPVTIGTPIELNNGQINSVMQELDTLGPFSGLNVRATDDDCYLVPVVPDTSTCNQTSPITKWARMCLRNVDTKGSPKIVLSDLTCPVVAEQSRDTKCYIPRLIRDAKSGM
jgi:Flp pilus assembly protein TadG